MDTIDSYYIVAYDSRGKMQDLEKLDGKEVDINSVGSFLQQVLILGEELLKNNLIK